MSRRELIRRAMRRSKARAAALSVARSGNNGRHAGKSSAPRIYVDHVSVCVWVCFQWVTHFCFLIIFKNHNILKTALGTSPRLLVVRRPGYVVASLPRLLLCRLPCGR
jgi:hypothetical protein